MHVEFSHFMATRVAALTRRCHIYNTNLLHKDFIASGQLHWSGVQPVPPNVRKNILSWALTGTSSVVSIYQVSSQHPASLLHVYVHAYFLFLFGAKVLASIFIQEKLFGYIQCHSALFVFIRGYYMSLSIMASPGQRQGNCGHIMAGF